MSVPVSAEGPTIELERKLKHVSFITVKQCNGKQWCVFAQQITHHLRCLQRLGRTRHPQLHLPTRHRWLRRRLPPHSHHLHQQPHPCPLQTILLNLKSVSITRSSRTHTHAATASCSHLKTSPSSPAKWARWEDPTLHCTTRHSRTRPCRPWTACVLAGELLNEGVHARVVWKTKQKCG